MSPVQFTKLYFALKETVVKWAGFLIFYGTKLHGACESHNTKANVCLFVVCVWRIWSVLSRQTAAKDYPIVTNHPLYAP